MSACVKCGNEIPKKRKEILPHVKTCVSCSTTNKLVGVPLAIGKGEEIYTDLNIVTQESFREHSRLQRGTFASDNGQQ